MNDIKIIDRDPYLQPYKQKIIDRINNCKRKKIELAGKKKIKDFANAHLYFGLHKTPQGWEYRDWLPNATEVHLTGNFVNWEIKPKYKLKKKENGIFEIKLPENTLQHGDLYKLNVRWENGEAHRLSAYSNRVVQDPETKIFCSQIWNPAKKYVFQHKTPKKPTSILIYEAHIGMSSEEKKVSTFNEFRTQILPKIVKAGYTVLQLMAIQEHPYYASFGYHVSNFFAVSSRFGTPEELKKLIDEAHKNGLWVTMDIVHSHAVKNENEGISKYDGTEYQYFHHGQKGQHPAWDSRCFDYGKNEVLHFLLSNCKFWIEEYNIDGFRFDGVTSMIYLNHGLGHNFTSYEQYYNNNIDKDALTYLTLANELIHEIKPQAIVVAEEMSGMPGIATPISEGGIGFDYRLAMGIPDYWIKLLKELPDEKWNVADMFFQLTNKRTDEKIIAYVESHDQALVGDKTTITWLAGKDIYFFMDINKMTLKIERAIALHKIIRLLTITLAQNAYLNFMGNEFAHPEWIDFPRQGNNWSYEYARRQWKLSENKNLAFFALGKFDRDMLKLMKKYNILNISNIKPIAQHANDQILIFERTELIFVFNFNPKKSFENYGFETKKGNYKIIFNSDNKKYLGYERLDEKLNYKTQKINNINMLKLYIPNRCAFVLKKKTKK